MSFSFDNSEIQALTTTFTGASRKALSRAVAVVRKSTFDVVRVGKRNAPVDTGNLRSSITGNTAGTGLVGEAGPTANYGGFVERGTSRMAPQPYMAPALDAVEPSFMEAMARAGEEALDD